MGMLVPNSAYLQHWRNIKAAGLESAFADTTMEEFKRVCGLLEFRSLEFTEVTISSTLAEVRGDPHLYRIVGTLRYVPWSTGRASDETAVRSNKETAVQNKPSMLDMTHDAQNETDSEAAFFMSGAVHARDKIIRRSSNDNLCCESDFETMAKHMPYKLMGRKDMDSLDLFENPKSLTMIPWCFRTTVIGIKRAIAAQARFGKYASDHTLIGSLAVRGGRIWPDKRVEYPEDIVPYYEEDEHPPDPDYWEALERQGDMGAVWQVLSDEDMDDCAEVAGEPQWDAITDLLGEHEA